MMVPTQTTLRCRMVYKKQPTSRCMLREITSNDMDEEMVRKQPRRGRLDVCPHRSRGVYRLTMERFSSALSNCWSIWIGMV